MRILHVHDQATFQGGVERILFDTARGLSSRGWPQALLSSTPAASPEFTSPFERCSDDLSIIDKFRPDAVMMHKVSDLAWIAELANTLPTAYMVHDHDLVCPRRHKYFPLGHGVCNLPAGKACFTNLCFVQRAARGSRLPIRIAGTSRVRRGLEATRNVNRFLVGSAYMRQELVINGIDTERVSVVHPVPASLRIPGFHGLNASPEILFVGQVIRGKGVDLLLRALSRLEGNWRARIVGEGNHLPACRDLAEELGIAEQVAFTGWVDHDRLDEYYAAARLLVVPSRWPEPFGMVGIEAMARGRPVVAFATGGIPDWLEDGLTGLLVPPGDVDGMAAAIRPLLDNPDLAHRMGLAAVQHVKERFSHYAYLGQVMQQMEHIA
jgi:glycosyltransferase involved in cell wall biosynthesis